MTHNLSLATIVLSLLDEYIDSVTDILSMAGTDYHHTLRNAVRKAKKCVGLYWVDALMPFLRKPRLVFCACPPGRVVKRLDIVPVGQCIAFNAQASIHSRTELGCQVYWRMGVCGKLRPMFWCLWVPPIMKTEYYRYSGKEHLMYVVQLYIGVL